MTNHTRQTLYDLGFSEKLFGKWEIVKNSSDQFMFMISIEGGQEVEKFQKPGH